MRRDWYTFLDNTRRPDLVSDSNLRKYSVIMLACIVALFVHVLFIGLFATIGAYQLVSFNIISLSCWALAAYVNHRGMHRTAMAVGLAEAAVHASYAVSVLGLSMGFQYYLCPIVCLVLLNPSFSLRTSIVIGFTTAFLFGFVNWYWSDKTYTYSYPQIADFTYFVNLTFASVPLVLGMIMMRSMNEHQEFQLRKVAHRDHLTDLYNRRYMSEFFDNYFANKESNLGQLTLALGDIDHFKQINDTFGHNIGDQVLKTFADYLKSTLRRSDFVCRWGGEEFMIVFPNSSASEIEPVIENIRKNLADISHDGLAHKITMSFGLTHIRAGESFDDLVKRADQALYQAKARGRNLTVTELPECKLSPQSDILRQSELPNKSGQLSG